MTNAGSQVYEAVGQEYYGEDHSTCRNFESATAAYLAAHPSILAGIRTADQLLDVGSGAGMTAMYLGELTGNLVQLDRSSTMLRQASGPRVRGDAYMLPFADQVFGAVTAFLYDPFNDPSPKGRPSFEQEVARVLKPGGTFVGTLPSFDWASVFRRSYEQGFRNTERTNDTYFTLEDGTKVREPSYVAREDELRYRFWAAGFDKVETYGVPASYIVGKVARPILETAYEVNYYAENPLGKLPIVTIVRACNINQARYQERVRQGLPPSWLRLVLPF